MPASPHCKAVATHGTDWDPSSCQPTLNLTLDACFVPGARGARLDVAHLVVLDGFIDEPIRKALLDEITAPDWDHQQGPPKDKWDNSTKDTPDHPRTWGLKHEALLALEASTLAAKLEVQSRLAALYPEVTIAHQPSDAIQAPPDHAPSHTSGPNGACTDRGAAQWQEPHRPAGDAMLTPSHVPPNHSTRCPVQKPLTAQQFDTQTASSHAALNQHHLSNQQAPQRQLQQEQEEQQQQQEQGRGQDEQEQQEQEDQEQELGVDSPEDCEAHQGPGTSYDCHAMLANAAMHGDEYGWHQDADPQTFPDTSPFVLQHGLYTNREPGKPLFVSLLLYLNDHWPRDWAAETLFLDVPSDTGIMVRPRPYRVVLMDQDLTHRLSAPTRMAQGRPRYSLVWKLVFIPKTGGQQCSLSRPEWGPPAPFGSAAKAHAMVEQLARKRQRTAS